MRSTANASRNDNEQRPRGEEKEEGEGEIPKKFQLTTTIEPSTQLLFKPTVILHGGAGNITREKLPPELWQQYRSSLLTYVRSTYDLLKSGATALDASVHAVSLMEDDPLFNCGRGSVFTSAGTIEMEASVMVTSLLPPTVPPRATTTTATATTSFPSPGSTLASSRGQEDAVQWVEYKGQKEEEEEEEEEEEDIYDDEHDSCWSIKRAAGVMNIRNVRHPIQLARELLLRPGIDEEGNDVTGSDGGNMHAQLSGPYAESLARDWGLEFKPDEWFWTRKRWEEHRRGLLKKRPTTSSTFSPFGYHYPYPHRHLDNDDHSFPKHSTTEGQHTGYGSSAEPALMEIPSQGTVGCVCLDQWGNLATATSTGGLTNKKPGRIGDTPTLGAGFWAESWDEEEVELEAEVEAEMGRQESKMPAQYTKRVSVLSPFDMTIMRGREQKSARSFSPFAVPAINWHALHPWNLCQDLFLGGYCLPAEDEEVEHEPERDLKRPLLLHDSTTTNSRQDTTHSRYKAKAKKTRRAVALSGTGNGDSFLRVNAARTASAMLRFSAPSFVLGSGPSAGTSSASAPASTSTSVVRTGATATATAAEAQRPSRRNLAHAVSAVAGPNGELQRSAGRRWSRTGEGEGGLIGIEAGIPIEGGSIHRTGDEPGLRRGRVVFDFNCGGMYRAWIEETLDGDRERVMVFRDEY